MAPHSKAILFLAASFEECCKSLLMSGWAFYSCHSDEWIKMAWKSAPSAYAFSDAFQISQYIHYYLKYISMAGWSCCCADSVLGLVDPRALRSLSHLKVHGQGLSLC